MTGGQALPDPTPNDHRELLFGSCLTPDAAQPQRVLALARLSEQLGLQIVSVQDHPYRARFLDSWTLLSVIAASTERIAVVPNVANLPMRPPVVLARSVATLDLLSGGRVELGLGAGAFWDAIAANGGPRRTPGESVDALEEAISVIGRVWDVDGGAIHADGRHYQLRGAQPGPAPAHSVGIWVGSYKARMLALTGRLADGWLPSSSYAPPEQLRAMNAQIDDGAEAAGRRAADIRRLYNIAGRFANRSGGFLDGPSEQWAEQLAELTLVEHMSGYILASDDPDTLRRFASEVVPAVRELVATGRQRSAEPVGSPPPAPLPRVSEVAPGAFTGSEVRAIATSDGGARLSQTRLWDEATRPIGPPPDPKRRYTAAELASSQTLVAVHDHLRSELRAVRRLVDGVLAGSLEVPQARQALAAMTLRQNSWTMGTYCAAYCRLVTTHHTIEDRSVFPRLRRSDPRLAAVLDRLEAEHATIHEVLEEVDRALVLYLETPDSAPALQEALDVLTDTLLSHLAYEERELAEPLAESGFI